MMEAARTPWHLDDEVRPRGPDPTVVVSRGVLERLHRDVNEVHRRLSERLLRLQRLDERCASTHAQERAKSAGLRHDAEQLQPELAAARRQLERRRCGLGVRAAQLEERERKVDELERTVAGLTPDPDRNLRRGSGSESHVVPNERPPLAPATDLELQLAEAKTWLAESEEQVSLLWDALVESERAAAQVARLDDAVDEIRRELRARRETDRALARPALEGGFLCFVSDTKGYRLALSTGRPPHVGDTFVLDGREQMVIKVATSRLPSDPRPCAYLQEIS
jgi:hypothetical protein